MRFKYARLSTVFLLGLCITKMQAQESINTLGGEAFGIGGSVSYSIGQVSYQTHINTSGSVSEGVQQPYEISVITSIEDTESINLFVVAYPNPTKDYLTIEVENFELSSLTFQLFDSKGKLLKGDNIGGNRTIIDMSHRVSTIYFLRILQRNNQIKTFKIIKN